MKKNIIVVIVIMISFNAFSQSSHIFLHQDTTVLHAIECKWLVRLLSKNDSTKSLEKEKSVPLIILESVENGKLKATDPITNKIIPAKEIFTWQMPKDTVEITHDLIENLSKSKIIQQRVHPDDISQIRVFHDWFFDISTGKIQSNIKWVELIVDVYTSTGMFIGIRPFCRINY